MKVEKATLDGTPVIDQNAVYLVDFTKCQSVNDMVVILQSVGFSFSPMHPQFENIKHLLDLSRPIQIGNPQAVSEAQGKKIQLPKLKTIKPNGTE